MLIRRLSLLIISMILVFICCMCTGGFHRCCCFGQHSHISTNHCWPQRISSWSNEFCQRIKNMILASYVHKRNLYMYTWKQSLHVFGPQVRWAKEAHVVQWRNTGPQPTRTISCVRVSICLLTYLLTCLVAFLLGSLHRVMCEDAMIDVKVDIFIFMLDFELKVKEIKTSIDLIAHTCSCLRASQPIKTILKAVCLGLLPCIRLTKIWVTTDKISSYTLFDSLFLLYLHSHIHTQALDIGNLANHHFASLTNRSAVAQGITIDRHENACIVCFANMLKHGCVVVWLYVVRLCGCMLCGCVFVCLCGCVFR